ncbi:MASE4 domain-containing protein [Paenibacillus dendritiformis]|uniref:MASE4 domain-containing protein n=1 Tax=Paenibacillus dendritiformis TaxID=130049 RepID=UPI00364C52B8
MLRMRDPLTSLINIPATAVQRKTALSISIGVFAVSLLISPYVDMPLPEVRPFLPIFIAWIVFGNLMTAYLLYVQFRATGYKPILLLAAAFLFAGLITIPYLLTFPGIFSATGLLHAGPQTSVWFWVIWHAGFPLGIILYTYSLRKWKSAQTERREKATVAAIFGAVVLLTAVLAYLLGQFRDELPVVIEQNHYRLVISSGIGPVLWLLNLLALVYLYIATRAQSLLHLWLTMSAFMFWMDINLTLFAGERYSIGWYAARINSFISSTALLTVFFHELNQLYVRLIHSQTALKQSQERVETILDSITDAFLAVNQKWEYTYMNKEAEKYTGLDFEAVKGRSIWTVNPLLLKSKMYAVSHQVMERGEPAELTEYDKLQDRWLEFRIFPTGQGVSVYFRDVTDRVAAEGKLKEANKKLQMANRLLTDFSYTDGLTGVYNRRYFDLMLQQEWERMKQENRPLSLILLDIDDFKRYNDTYGHQAGDECLRQVAQAVKAAVTQPLSVAARYGGEEFAVLLPHTPAMNATIAAEAIRLQVESLTIRHEASEVSHFVTCSLGAATWIPGQQEHCPDPQALVQMADRGLYAAKRDGRNRVRMQGNGPPG